jgi:hypothetical protein
MSDLIDKVSKLLKQSEHAATEAERDVFLAKAQDLATVAQIDLAVARSRTEKREARAVPTVKRVIIAERGKRGNKQLVELFSSIGNVNSVNITIYKGDHMVDAYGFEEDIDLTKALYDSLVVQMKIAADAYLRTGEYKKELIWVEKYETQQGWYGRERVYVGAEQKPVDGRIARHSFQNAWRRTVSTRLREAKEAAQLAAEAAELNLTTEELVNASEHRQGESSTNTAIALRAKEVEVYAHYKKHTGHIRGSWSGSSSKGSSSSAMSAGRAAGARASFGTSKAISA